MEPVYDLGHPGVGDDLRVSLPSGVWVPDSGETVNCEIRSLSSLAGCLQRWILWEGRDNELLGLLLAGAL